MKEGRNERTKDQTNECLYAFAFACAHHSSFGPYLHLRRSSLRSNSFETLCLFSPSLSCCNREDTGGATPQCTELRLPPSAAAGRCTADTRARVPIDDSCCSCFEAAMKRPAVLMSLLALTLTSYLLVTIITGDILQQRTARELALLGHEKVCQGAR